MLEDDLERFRSGARRRLLVLGGLNGVLFVLLGGRLFHLQVMKGGAYRVLAENNRISLQPVSAPRGLILDRFGKILVENSPDYRLAAIPELTGGMRGFLDRVAPILSMSEEDLETVLRQAKRQRSFLPVKVRARLSWEELSRIEAEIYNLPGGMIQVQSIRHYPYDKLAAHVLGYLGEVSESDIRDFHDTRFRSGDLVGKTGTERVYESELRGREGVREVEVNALGRQVRELKLTPAVPGQDLYLTLDTTLQQESEAALAGHSGSVVVMDPRTGEVLVMANQPAYDPNQFIRGFSSKQWKALVSDEDRPLTNKAIQGQYPPGSTFKMAVILAALKENRLTPEDRFTCPGYLDRQDHRFYCWKHRGHGALNLEQAIAQSCDVFFYKIAEKIGIDPIERMARNLGLGSLSGIRLNGEQAGLIPSRAWKRKVHKTIWYPGETLITAIGQGYVLSTPLQLANMTAAIANGGTLYRPALVRPNSGFKPEVLRHSRLNEEHLALIKKGMEKVYYAHSGTARRARPDFIRAAGKTGTAQVVRHRRQKDGELLQVTERRFMDHALFVCYAPADKPEIVISVVIEHGGHGGATAAPIAKQIMDRYFDRKRKS
ncbi:MAG: penicillin-binding protein 2 [Magnetococcales bacterium]|nr:penicillin-binding protein 2 [Magnetococcales bacterium]